MNARQSPPLCDVLSLRAVSHLSCSLLPRGDSLAAASTPGEGARACEQEGSLQPSEQLPPAEMLSVGTENVLELLLVQVPCTSSSCF